MLVIVSTARTASSTWYAIPGLHELSPIRMAASSIKDEKSRDNVVVRSLEGIKETMRRSLRLGLTTNSFSKISSDATHVSNHPSMKIATILTTAAVAAPALFLAPGVHAHGGMVVPEPRAIRTMGLSIDSTFGHPISVRAAYTNGKGGDCLDFTADTNLQSIPVGTSKIQMRTNDGANHIGPCTMYLVNPSDKSKKQQIGQLNDCMRSLHPAAGNKGDPPIPAEMTINVPENPEVCGKDHCVLEFYWEATHLDPHELFNNCADVKIGGGGSSGSTTTTTAPAPAATSAPAPAATSAPAPAATTAPATGGGSYVYSGPARADSASMTTWCNQNCPSFCPTDICKAA